MLIAVLFGSFKEFVSFHFAQRQNTSQHLLRDEYSIETSPCVVLYADTLHHRPHICHRP